jgi:hypothetical protein
MAAGDRAILDEPRLSRLYDALRSRGYEAVTPTARDGTNAHDTLASASRLARLPVGRV